MALASLGAALLLALAMAGAEELLGATDLCVFERPAQAKCALELASSHNLSCTIYKLPTGSCFENWPHCWDNKTFVEDEHFFQTYDADSNTTNVTIMNIRERRLLLTTLMPEEAWWQVDLPDGEKNITITGLPGHLDENNPVTQPSVNCKGCPPPRIQYIALRKLHTLKVMVSLPDDIYVEDKPYNVSITMASSNETNFDKKNCTYPHLHFTEVARGVANQPLSIEGVYSTKFCFGVRVNFGSSHPDISPERRYMCHRQENMTEPPYRPSQAHIKLPIWWVVGLIAVLICLGIAALAPLAFHKGLLRAPCGRRTPRPDGDGECCSEDERRPRPVLRADAAAATSPADAYPLLWRVPAERAATATMNGISCELYNTATRS